MRLSSKIRFGLLAVGVLLAGWEGWRQARQGRELVEVEAQVRAGEQEAESQRAALAAAEQRNREVVEAEQRAGNQGLLTLMRERAAAAKSGSDAAAKANAFGNALASVLDSPGQVEKDYMRDQMRANLDVFFKLTNLSPEKTEQYLDMEIDTKRRNADRLAALLRGSIPVEQALSQRDEDRRQQESRRREILGPEGQAVLDSVADGMRNNEAKRQVGAIQQNMGGEPLSQEQSDRLQGLIKTAVSADSLDNTDLFRPPEEWTQIVSDRQQTVVRGAAEFLTPTQMETLKALVGLDLAQRQEQRAQQAKALGIRNGAQN